MSYQEVTMGIWSRKSKPSDDSYTPCTCAVTREEQYRRRAAGDLDYHEKSNKVGCPGCSPESINWQ